MLFLEFGFEKLPSKKLASVRAILLVSSMLSSCVTTTTGGFMAVASEERAATDYIQLEGYFQNEEFVENVSLVLATLHPTSQEFQTFQRLSDAN